MTDKLLTGQSGYGKKRWRVMPTSMLMEGIAPFGKAKSQKRTKPVFHGLVNLPLFQKFDRKEVGQWSSNGKYTGSGLIFTRQRP